jgi:hypothetical protein
MDEVLLELPGYHTFDLDSAIQIPAGEDFYVQIKYDSNDPNDIWPIAVEDTIDGYAQPELETGKYWIAPDPNIWPTAWYPVGVGTSYHYDLCIKAYAHELFNISGTVKYDDTLQTALENVKIYLMSNDSCCVDSTQSNADGSYAFSGLRSGNYHLEAATDLSFGGVNSTDALAVSLHHGNVPGFALEGAALLAADANNDAVVDSLDAELIQNRSIMIIENFPASELVFFDDEVMVNGADALKDLTVLFRGDVNGSRFWDEN